MRQTVDPATRRLRTLLSWVAAFCVLWLAWEALAYAWHLSRLPRGLNAPFVLSATERAWGIGMPGDNETGVLIFALAPGEGRRILRQGLAGLEDRTGVWWEATPIKASDPPMAAEDWLYEDGTGEPHPPGHRPSIADFLDRYGFGIGIGKDSPVIDDILNSPGSFYTYGRGGSLILVAPKRGRVIYAYAG